MCPFQILPLICRDENIICVDRKRIEYLIETIDIFDGIDTIYLRSIYKNSIDSIVRIGRESIDTVGSIDTIEDRHIFRSDNIDSGDSIDTSHYG